MTLTADTSTSSGLYEKRWFALWSLCLSLLIVVVGNTSLNVVIPTLAKELASRREAVRISGAKAE